MNLTMRDYQYQPLQHGEIRLLRLDPVTSPGQALSGSILHHRLTNPTYRPGTDGQPAYLEQPRRYEAISYHWGADASTPHRLCIVDDDRGPSVIRLTAALRAVLDRLALPDRHRVLWADAICINQVTSRDNEEKGAQIKLMPDIYRVAAALDLLTTIADHSEYLDDSQQQYPAAQDPALVESETAIALARRRRAELALPPPTDARWAALRAFLRRPWFRRVWVIQELCLAAKAYCDNRSLIFAGFKPDPLSGTRTRDEFREAHEGARALHVIADLRMRAWGYMSTQYMVLSLDHDHGPASSPSGLSVRKNFDAIRSFEDLMRDKLLMDRASGDTFPFGQPDLLELLHRTSNFLASQPVDRLYALLGLADDTGHLEPIYSDRQTLPVVTTRFAASFIRKGRLADVLATAGIRSETPSAGDPPSWVPDWTKVEYAQDHAVGFNRFSSIQKEPADHSDARSATRDVPEGRDAPEGSKPVGQEAVESEGSGARRKLYNAALNTEQAFTLDEAQGTLTIRAIAVDKVLLVLPGRLLLGTPMYAGMAQRLGQVYSTGEPIEEAVWRTLIANRTYHGERPPPDFEVQYQNLKRHEMALLTRAIIILGVGCLLALPFATLGIRYMPVIVQVTVVTGLMATRKVPAVPGVVFLVLLPVFRWLWVIVLVPVLMGLTWYCGAKAYPLQFLEVLKGMGVTTAVTTGSMPADCAGYLTSFSVMGNRHALCFTEHRLMGLLPLLTKVGDIVAVFHGCDVPFVVRPTERQGYYRLVGECYVHGVMNGDCVAGQPSDIVLC
ncbi:heterokaryon incompatibility protein [Hirsutella rhossiliensis]|uniref:Heterokaryon incompatibility protein (HET) domain-containing protein n=1 Tax=Hirsutella rhossiliensis TaxID=111463 RepID=A0A9P8SDX8_9HYPO|nr:heterokaryon incompatibility protein (HET) domain-containing protein [Hirsutella rhossiliensis]KAH0959223.1 heterokaryon incompatibility protein (HET) domain-containing protein [Hirsutella rhossiliensis]